MFSKINISKIIRDHILTLVNYRTGKISGWDLLLFFGVPVLAAALILFGTGTLIDRATSNILITSLSVFSGLLLNLLIPVFDLVSKERQEPGPDGKPAPRLLLLREIFANISYSIVVSVFCIAILLIAYLEIESDLFHNIFSFTVYFLVIQFLLTLFMVLKRVHILLSIPFMVPALPPPQPPPKPRPAPSPLRSGGRKFTRKGGS